MLIGQEMTPAAVELSLEIRKEIEDRYEEAGRLRCRAIERAQIEADLAQRRFMLVDPNNRLVADTLEGEWNDKLRVLAKARDDRERAREQDQLILDEAVRERLIAMTADFNKLWADPDTPNRERKRLLAHIIEDVTLIKMPAEGTTKIHIRFKGGKIQTLTTMSPQSSAQQVKTLSAIVELVDKLLDEHIYSEIAELLNQQGYRPGGSVRPGRHETRFTTLRVAYLAHRYKLRSRYDRLRDRGMLTKREAAARINIHETPHQVDRTWTHHQARLRWAALPVRTSGIQPAAQAMQQMESARRSSYRSQGGNGAKTLSRSRRRCSMNAASPEPSQARIFRRSAQRVS
jgi:hypothetical protein